MAMLIAAGVRKFLLATACAAYLAACTTQAEGPVFGTNTVPSVQSGHVRVFVFRDKVLYLAQAPYIRSTSISVDGKTVGQVQNGGFIVLDVPSGQHWITAASGDYQTKRYFNATWGDGYIEITDKTRMAGARMIGEAVSGAVEANGNAILAGVKASQSDLIAGAMTAISQDEAYSGPERVWDITFPTTKDTLPRLSLLRLAQ